MKSTVLSAARRFEFKDVPEPEPGANELVVEVEAVAICGSDLAAFRGDHPRMVPPLVLGHEFSGRVAYSGEGVADEMAGARVAVDPVLSCGTCPACHRGQRNLCPQYRLIGCSPEHPGAFQALVRAPVSNVTDLQNDSSYVAGTLIQPLAISHHAVVDRAQIQPEDDVMVIGAGPVGLGCVLLAADVGARVAAVELDPFRRDLAIDLGAAEAFSPDDLSGELPGQHTGRRPNVVLEAVGGRQGSTLDMALKWCDAGGRVVILGNFAKGTTPIDPELVKSKQLTVSGAQGYSDSYAKVAELLAGGRIAADQLVSHVMPLNDPASAFALLEDPSVNKAKVVLSKAGA